MLIKDMTRDMSVDLLKRTHIGRLGSHAGLKRCFPLGSRNHVDARVPLIWVN
jgi:hypothetical protein